MKHTDVVISVKTDITEILYTHNSPTRLGLFLESMGTQKYTVVKGNDLAWVQQVIKNLEQGYSYVKGN